MTRSVFTDRVFAIVARIPVGRVSTYGDVAALAGGPRAARSVGTLMSRARMPGLPYHRVIAAGGRLGGYGGAIELKASLLRAEGLIVRGSRVVNFDERRWQPKPRRASAPTVKTPRPRPARRTPGRPSA